MGNAPHKVRGLTRDMDASTEDYGPAVVPSSFSYAGMGGKSPSKSGYDERVEEKGANGGDADRKVLTVFEWSGKADKCAVAGTFNNWKNAVPMTKHPTKSPSKFTFKTTIELPEGDYDYKFCVDDNWVCDTEKEMSPNIFGTKNNVVRVRVGGEIGGDIMGDVMEALDFDEDDNHSLTEGSFGQAVPPPTKSLPPTLPRHLLQIILNKKVPDHVEPTLLPEPNHVMLNHLYALSIKDGVMVLSTTHRHRRKYITTLFYTPI